MTTNWILIAVLVVILVAFIFMSVSRRKKDAEYRADLESKILPGAKVKTYSGLYGTVVSVTDTTDGKIILIKTGEGNNVSYQSLHINAIFGFDTKQPVRYDAEGNVIVPEDLSAKKEETAATVAPVVADTKKEETAEKKATKPAAKKEVKATKKVEPAKVEEKKAEKKVEAKKPATKKPAAKKTTTDKK